MSIVSTSRFEFHPTTLEGVWRVLRKPIGDNRGFFARLYCAEEFAAIGLAKPLAQINHSFSKLRGTVRGLHFQHPPHAESKVVTCMAGRIFDVAVDLRRGSPSFLHWFGTELSADNRESLVIPPGFAHGFQTLSDNAEIMYLVTAAYSAQAEDGINPFDPAVGIRWPETVSEISPRDAQREMLNPAEYAGISNAMLEAPHG
jgi:dTDP-4-dehydrorhamnose 3,5-epimerase